MSMETFRDLLDLFVTNLVTLLQEPPVIYFVGIIILVFIARLILEIFNSRV